MRRRHAEPTVRPLGTREGYLLLADISGYTAFLTGTELEHAHGITRELTTLLRDRLAPPMRFVKLEGDAVFCYADAKSFDDCERLVELIETCYFAFSNRLLDMQRSTTCPCAACRAIGSLDLKFVTHYGSFVVERDGDREDVSGPAVILVHRLLKNTVIESGGPPAYAFLTAACLDRLRSALALPDHTESYESFGEVNGGVHDLRPVLEAIRAAQHAYIGPAEADFEITHEVPYAPAVLWQYFVDPDKRVRWRANQKALDTQPNELGRLGAGAASHCAHGLGPDALREYLDWRPYAYFTCRFMPLRPTPLFIAGVETTEFVPTDARTTMVHFRFRADDRGRLARTRARSFAVLYRTIAKRSEQRCREIMREDGFLEWSEVDERAG